MARQKLGVFGAGQLAQMTCVAGRKLGYEMHVFAGSESDPAVAVADQVWIGDLQDDAQVIKFAKTVDAFAYDTEHLPIAAVRLAADYATACPSPDLLFATQNRIRERKFLHSIDVPMPRVAFIETVEDIHLVKGNEFPAVLKTAEQGYDGKGQRKVANREALMNAWSELGEVACVLEELVDFEREMSVIVARDAKGSIQVYPVTDNEHRNHILFKSSAPSGLPEQAQKEALSVASRIAEAGQLVGILAVEMFYTTDGKVLVNELAPRPHNSGHHTQLSATISQFAALVLAMAGEPIGSIQSRPSVMINILGDVFVGENSNQDYLHSGFLYPDSDAANVYFYGKKEARQGRKMGHSIGVGDSLEEAEKKADALYEKYLFNR